MRSRPSLALLLAIGATSLVSSCGNGESTVVARTWPAGTVVAVNDTPITSAEVDEWIDLIAEIEAKATLPRLRRAALTTILFPSIVAQDLDPEGRLVAEEAAKVFLATLKAGKAVPADAPVAPFAPVGGPEERRQEGLWIELGPHLGRAAREGPLGEWTLVEGVGAFYCLKTLERDGDPVQLAAVFYEFPWLPPIGPSGRSLVEETFGHARLTIVDPSWDEVVPEYWRHLMAGDDR